MAQLQNIIIGIILGSALLTGFLMVSEDMRINYGVSRTSDLNESEFNKTDEIYAMVRSGSSDLTGQDTDEDDTASSMLAGAFNVARRMFQAPTIALDIVRSVITTLGGGQFIIGIVASIILILVLFAIINNIFRIG